MLRKVSGTFFVYQQFSQWLLALDSSIVIVIAVLRGENNQVDRSQAASCSLASV